MSVPSPADWQLPPGVSRPLWDYLHSPEVARGYDAGLLGNPLVAVDVGFVAGYCPPRGRLLDLGCGTGRLLVPMAERGNQVVGVDLSVGMLAAAAAKAEAAGVPVRLLRANLAELDALRDGTFDCAACLFSTLGMVSGQEARRRVMAHAFRLLRPGGRLVLHVHNRWFNARDAAGRRWLVRDLVRSILGRPDAGDRAMPAHQGVAGLALHHFTRREAVGLLRGAGFRVAEVKPVGLAAGGRLPAAWCLGRLRAYGFLLAARR